MTRFLHSSASLIGLCVLALAIGCGDDSKKKSNCDGPCADAIRGDASGDGKKDGSPDGLPSDARVTPDTLPTDALVPTDAVPGDAFVATPDTQPVIPGLDAGDAATSDTRLPDTRLPDTGVTPDTQLDTIPVQTDTAIADGGVVDAPVTVDAPVEVDASLVDVASDVGDAFDDAGDAGDAEIDSI